MKPLSAFNNIKHVAKSAVSNIDVNEIKDKAAAAGEMMMSKASDAKDAAAAVKEDIDDKLKELDHMLEQAITDYNDAYTQMNDKGISLYIERCRANDLISFVEAIVNSIANHPKSFDSDFEQINIERKQFIDTCEFADRELQAARAAAGGAGAGLAAGASVAFMAPTAAMWIATTFGTASTGTAISTLSGAAATNAALAWLGGGAVAAGGGGMAAGNALLALAGPVGWTIAGATLMSSIVIFSTQKVKLNNQKNKEITKVKDNTEKVKEIELQINQILSNTMQARSGLSESYKSCMKFYGVDYTSLNIFQKKQLGNLINNTKALSALFEKSVN